jgi:UTP--glucose-1-phosphate uridylyltransferase
MKSNRAEAKHLPAFIKKMNKADLPQIAIDSFCHHYQQVVSGETGFITDGNIEPVDFNEIETLQNLAGYSEAGKNALPHTVRIVLNGGLGTSMGLTQAKSLLEIKNGQTFLEIILKQIAQSPVSLALMNSFYTQQDTEKALSWIKPPSAPLMFLQHKYPKILQQDLAPADWSKNRNLEWNPPGHGNIYIALQASGTLDRLLRDGLEYAFISNSDNLGAILDPRLLGFFSKNRLPFLMEVAERTPADNKGGHLARNKKDGRLLLREVAQCPKEELKAFVEIPVYRFFNTNSIWVNLKFLKALLNLENTVHLPLILNPKTLDPRDHQSPKVFQIETAMGAAISLFKGANAVVVPKSRLVPVKKCNDILAVRSDCYVLTQNGQLIVNPLRKLESLSINLDPSFYGKLDLLDERFKDGIPSLIECESLTIKGDVRFGKRVTIRGNVIIENRQDVQATIEDGTIIDQNLLF